MPLTAWDGMSVCSGRTGGGCFSAARRRNFRRLEGDIVALHSIYRWGSVASVVGNVQPQANS